MLTSKTFVLASGILDHLPALPKAFCVSLHKQPMKWLLQPDHEHLVKSLN